MPTAELHQLMEQLKAVLASSFRKGDLIARWNNYQYVLLLTGLDSEKAVQVLKRTAERFYAKCPDARVNLLISANPHLELEKSP